MKDFFEWFFASLTIICVLLFGFHLGQGSAATHCTNYGKAEIRGVMYECRPLGKK